MRRIAAFTCTLTFALTSLADGLDVRDLPPIPEIVSGDTGDTTSSIAVLAATLAEEDTVVGASKREQSLGTVASAVTVLSGDRLRRFGYRTVAEALRSAAGLYVVDDRMTERLGVRGVQILGDFNTRILVLVDGATLNEPWNQFTGLGYEIPVNIDDVDRIEIVRGPVSSLYGTNAFLGIVNIVTRGADRSAKAYGRLSSSSFGTLGGAAGFGTGDVNRQLRGNVFFQNRGGESVPIAALDDTTAITADGMQAFNAGLVAHYDGAFAQVRAFRRVRELAASPYDTAINDPRNRNVDQMIMFEGGYTRDVGDFTLSARAYFNRYQFQDYLVYEPDDPNFEDIGDSTWAGLELRALWRILPKDRLSLTVGAEANLNKVESRSFDEGDEANGLAVPSNFDIEGVYADIAAELTPWAALSAGARFDRNSDWVNKVSPRAALLLHKDDDFGLKLLYAQGFRNPSPLEAFFEDGMTFLANPNLDPETNDSLEAVIWGRPIPGLNLRLSGFRWTLGGLLELVSVEQGGVTLKQYQNLTEIVTTGVELEASYRDTSGWYAFAAATFAIVEADGDAEKALNAPKIVGAAGISSPRLADLFHISTELQFIGERRTRDPLVTAEANLRWNVALSLPSWHDLDVTIGVRNLLGSREQVPAQLDFDRGVDSEMPTNLLFIPGEGREFYARVGYSY